MKKGITKISFAERYFSNPSYLLSQYFKDVGISRPEAVNLLYIAREKIDGSLVPVSKRTLK